MNPVILCLLAFQCFLHLNVYIWKELISWGAWMYTINIQDILSIESKLCLVKVEKLGWWWHQSKKKNRRKNMYHLESWAVRGNVIAIEQSVVKQSETEVTFGLFKTIGIWQNHNCSNILLWCSQTVHKAPSWVSIHPVSHTQSECVWCTRLAPCRCRLQLMPSCRVWFTVDFIEQGSGAERLFIQLITCDFL